MDAGKYIKEKREGLHLSLADLAERLGKFGYAVERQTINHWEHGRNNPPLESKEFRSALALALEIDINEMLGNVGFIVIESKRSPEARKGADMIDLMTPNKRKLAVAVLEDILSSS